MDSKKKPIKFERATQEQLQYYTQFCQQHPAMLAGKNNATAPKIIKEFWEECANGLNGCRGPIRTAEKWKENLTVWKCQLRARARKIRMNQRITGGGPCGKSLSDFEEQALSVFGAAAVEGMPNVESYGISSTDNVIEEASCSSQSVEDLTHGVSCDSFEDSSSTLEPSCIEVLSPVASTSSSGRSAKINRQAIYNTVMESLEYQKELMKKREEEEHKRQQHEEKILEMMIVLSSNMIALSKEVANIKNN